MFIAALFTIAKIWKPPKYPPKMNGQRCGTHTYTYVYIHTHTQRNITQPEKKNENLPYATT